MKFKSSIPVSKTKTQNIMEKIRTGYLEVISIGKRVSVVETRRWGRAKLNQMWSLSTQGSRYIPRAFVYLFSFYLFF